MFWVLLQGIEEMFMSLKSHMYIIKEEKHQKPPQNGMQVSSLAEVDGSNSTLVLDQDLSYQNIHYKSAFVIFYLIVFLSL